MRRNKVCFLYNEKSWPDCSRKRMIILSRLLNTLLSKSGSVLTAGLNLSKAMSLAGNSSTGATTSAMTASMALVGMPLNFAVTGDCTSTIPFFSLMAFSPRVPSEPMPERMMPMLLSCMSSAIERKKISMGKRNPRDSTGSNKCSVPRSIDRLLLGGITYTQFGCT